MQIFVSYITASIIFGFLATWHAYFCQHSKCFFGVFSACSEKHRKEVSGDLHINLVVHSPGKERLFVTSSYWCVSVFFLDILSFLIVWLHQQLKDIHLPMNNVRLSTATRLIINLDYAIIPSCDF